MKSQTGVIATAEQLETTGSGGGGGDATAANQVIGNASLASIDSKIPASPATTAKQDTGNTALAAIATSVADIDTVQGAKADAAWSSGDGTVIAILKKIAGGTGGGGAVTIADGADVAQGAVADSAWVSGNGTVVAILKGIFGKLATVISTLGSPFQAGGSIGNTTFAATQGTAANLNCTEASAASILATAGSTTGAAVTTDSNGAIQQFLRGIVKLYTLLGIYAPVANDWQVHHVPATNVKATITQASAGAGNRNICHGITVTIASDATAPTVIAPLTVNLIDGASGGSTYLWRSIIAIPGVPGAQISIIKTFPKPIKGSQATAMTLEFSAAGGADTYESVSINGSSVTE